MTDADTRPDLLALSLAELGALLASWGEPRYRAAQVWQWLYQRLAEDPAEMTSLPVRLRERLASETRLTRLEVLDTLAADDGLTEKTLLGASDGQAFEAVLMRYPDRNTVCASSQIGCALGCEFCATGRGGLVRNLTAGEIVAQVLHFGRRLRAAPPAEGPASVTNVVFMGMGEPFLNEPAVRRAIANLHEPAGLDLGLRRFTISTAGYVPGIDALAEDGSPLGLAISLHAPDDALRSRLVPLNRRYPLDVLLAAVRRYTERTSRRVTFEYVLARGLNDSEEQARRLGSLLRGMLCHVNLIPLNPVAGCDEEPSPPARIQRFQATLERAGVPTTVRDSRGSEIRAGCGQLRTRRQGSARTE